MNESLREAIIDHNMEILHYLTMQPGNPVELALGLFVGISVLTIAIAKFHIISKSGSASLLVTLFVVAICGFLLIETASFTKHWLIPKFNLINMDEIAIATALGATFLFLVVPFTRILLHSGYFTSMTAWILGLIIAGAALYFIRMTYEEPAEGPTPIDTLESVKEHVEENLENAPTFPLD